MNVSRDTRDSLDSRDVRDPREKRASGGTRDPRDERDTGRDTGVTSNTLEASESHGPSTFSIGVGRRLSRTFN